MLRTIPQLVAAGVLSMAAVGKLLLLVDRIALSGITVGVVFALFQPVGELVLALFLARGCYRRINILGILLFLALSVISLHSHFQGHDECECFGVFGLNSLVVGLVDILISATLATSLKNPTPISWSGSISFCSLFALLTYTCAPSPARVQSGGVSTWQGSRLPILDCLSDSTKYKKNRWVVLLFSSDCAACETVVRRFEQSASDVRAARISFAAVDFADNPRRLIHSNCIRMDQVKNCPDIVRLPAVIAIDHGLVFATFSPIDFPLLEETLGELDEGTRD